VSRVRRSNKVKASPKATRTVPAKKASMSRGPGRVSRTGLGSKAKASPKATRAAPARKAAPNRKGSPRKSRASEPRSTPCESGHEELVNGSLFPLVAVAPNSAPAAEAYVPGLYDPDDIVDAPEHHALSKALGILSWDIWDHAVRPVSERRRDFVTAFPPREPMAFSLGGMERRAEHEWSPRARDREVERFLSRDGRANGIDNLLARYGLKLRDAPLLQLRSTPIRDFREAARERNRGLRNLHGSVDIEPKDMDSAKSAFVEQQERKRAAQEIRAARKLLKEDLEDGDGDAESQ
jgi:hypothetical protein